MRLIFFMNIRNSKNDVNNWRTKPSVFVAFQYGTNLRHFRRTLLSLSYILKIEAFDSPEVLVYLYQPGWHHAIEEWIFRGHCVENLKLHRDGKEEHTWAFCFLSVQVLKRDTKTFIFYYVWLWRQRVIKLIDNKHVHRFMH